MTKLVATFLFVAYALHWMGAEAVAVSLVYLAVLAADEIADSTRGKP